MKAGYRATDLQGSSLQVQKGVLETREGASDEGQEPSQGRRRHRCQASKATDSKELTKAEGKRKAEGRRRRQPSLEKDSRSPKI